MKKELLPYTLLKHHVRSIFRSRIWSSSSMVANLMVTILGVYLGLLALFGGWGAGEMIDKAISTGFIPTPRGGTSASTFIEYVSSVGLPLFFSWLVTRFFFQQSPVKNIRPYLILPLKRLNIANGLLISSFFNFLNLLPFLFLIPFTYFSIRPILGTYTSIFWFFSLILVTVFISNHLVTIFRLYLQKFPKMTLAPVLLIALFMGVDAWMKTGITSNISAFLFSPTTSSAVMGFIIVVFGLFLLLHLLAVNLLIKDIYLDHGKTSSASSATSVFISMLERQGEVAQYIALELKLIWRNKRTRQVLMVSLFILPLGVFYINQGRIKSDIATAIGSLFVTGAFAFNYGQLMFGWESAHMDGIWVRPINISKYIWAKILLLQASCLSLGFISQPLVLIFTPDRLNLFWSMLLFNMGVCCIVLVFVGLLSTKRIEVDRSTLLNYQGTGIQHYIVVLPVMIIPMLVLYFAGRKSVLILGSAGLAFVLLTPLWVYLMKKLFMSRRHRMLAGFREQ